MVDFSDLNLDKAGTGYTLRATGTGLTAGDSTAFDIDTDQLIVTTPPPALVAAGTGFGLVVSAENGAGVVDTSFNGPVTLSLDSFLGTHPTLGGKATVTAVNGVATFSSLTVAQADSYSLDATSPGLVQAFTPPFSVTGTAPASKAPAITSATSALFTAGTSGSFTITTTGFPVAALNETGALPGNVTFVDNGNGTATLSGTPTAGGTFTLGITANNGVLPNATQAFKLTVNQAPVISSANVTTFTVGELGSFPITTMPGFPTTTTLSKNGTLPSGVSFVVGLNGSATLKGTPAAGTGGTYTFTITASNSPSSLMTQTFTLTVDQPPAITSTSKAIFALGQNNTFIVTTKGFPNATLSPSGTLPGNVHLVDNGNGTATLSGTPTTAGDFTFTINASNGVVPAATQSFTLTVAAAPAFTTGNATTFKVGQAGTFAVKTTPAGATTTSLTMKGTLPGGVSFMVGPNGTATLKGTPTTGGSYPLMLSATSTDGTVTTQSFTLTVQQPPTFTSATSVTFTIGQAARLVITTKGFPFPTIAVSGILPGGITFVNNGTGTATLSGTPVAGSDGPYTLSFTATNGLSPNASGTLKLTVKPGSFS